MNEKEEKQLNADERRTLDDMFRESVERILSGEYTVADEDVSDEAFEDGGDDEWNDEDWGDDQEDTDATEIMSKLAVAMLSRQAQEDFVELTRVKDSENVNHDWKATALELMRAVDEKEKREQAVLKAEESNTEMETVGNVSQSNAEEKFDKKIIKLPEKHQERDEAIRESIIRIMDREDELLEEEIKRNGEHVFSEEFEHKMEEIMRVKTPEEKAKERRRRRLINTVRYTAAAVVTVLLLSGVILTSNRNINASKLSIDIKQWLDKAFTVEEGETTRKEDSVLFEESQIGYLPEGFEKTHEEVTFSKVYYKYQNDAGDYFVLEVRRNKIESMVDNKEIEQDICLNDVGYEYRYVYKEESDENIITWMDKEAIYYQLQGIIDQEEIIKIMNGIIY